MSGTITARNVISHPYFGLIGFVAVCFVLPMFSIVATMVCCAGLLTVLVALKPDPFRGRDKSLRTANLLVAATWIGAFITLVLTQLGEIR